MTRWQLKVLTQAELALAGVAFYGPWPPPAIKPVPTADVQAAAHQEISGYWRRIARQRKCWLQDTWVDSGLIVLPRTEAVLTTGDLITKTEAISRLADLGVPATLAQEIRRRRDGQLVTLSVVQKVHRGRLTRQIMRRGVQRLSRQPSALATELPHVRPLACSTARSVPCVDAGGSCGDLLRVWVQRSVMSGDHFDAVRRPWPRHHALRCESSRSPVVKTVQMPSKPTTGRSPDMIGPRFAGGEAICVGSCL